MRSSSRTRGLQVKRFTLLIALLAGVRPGLAQDDALLRVDTQLVLVDVVASGDALALAALSRDDFRIFDEGREQELSVFERVAGRTDLGGALVLPAGVASNLRDWRGAVPTSATVILVDRINTPTNTQVYANQELARFLASFEQMDGLALYELRSDGLRVLHDFIDDPSGLGAVVAAMEPEHSLALESSSSVGGFESDLANVGLDPVIGDNVTGGTGFDRRAADYFLDDRVQRTSSALETVARRLEGLRGRRNIVWLSGRFPFSFDIWARSDLANEIETGTMEQVESISRVLSESNIAIYPVDVRGPGDDGPEVFGAAESIAESSGGRSFRTNAVGAAIEAAVTDAAMTFTLGFYPAEQEDGRKSPLPEGRGCRRGFGPAVPSELRRLRRAIAGHSKASVWPNCCPARSTRPGSASRAWSGPPGTAPSSSWWPWSISTISCWSKASGRMRGSIDMGLVFRAADDGTAYVIPPVTFPIDLTAEQVESFRETGLIVQRFLDTEGRSGALRVAVRDTATGAGGSLWVPVGSN